MIDYLECLKMAFEPQHEHLARRAHDVGTAAAAVWCIAAQWQQLSLQLPALGVAPKGQIVCVLCVYVARACFVQAPWQARLPCAGGQGSQPASRLWVTAPLALRRRRNLVEI